MSWGYKGWHCSEGKSHLHYFQYLLADKLGMVQNGLYTLRASPVVGVGGMYMTGNGALKVVTVAAQVPDTFDRQTVGFYILGIFFHNEC